MFSIEAQLFDEEGSGGYGFSCILDIDAAGNYNLNQLNDEECELQLQQ